MAARVLLLIPTHSYKARDFMDAAARLGAEVVVGTDHRSTLEDITPETTTLALDFERPEWAITAILAAHTRAPFTAVVGTDDESTLVAALAGEALGLRHARPAAVRDARDKSRFRERLREAGLRGPAFRRIGLARRPGDVAREVRYPCVIKPLGMSASRGVVRADDPESFSAAFRRVAAIVRESGGEERANALLVEDYISGREVALEGLLAAGRLEVLALFDKPDPLEGPFFEETLYVTPSRLPETVRAAIVGEAEAACRALGLDEGPLHAELRVQEGVPWVLEVAPRTIGGLCSRTLRFGAGISLEELILRHALGLDSAHPPREGRAAGVMMIPIPRAGVLRGVDGLDRARSVAGIEGVEITIHCGSKVVPLPEGHSYLGFIFARGAEPAEVEAALRAAHAQLRFSIDD